MAKQFAAVKTGQIPNKEQEQVFYGVFFVRISNDTKTGGSGRSKKSTNGDFYVGSLNKKRPLPKLGF